MPHNQNSTLSLDLPVTPSTLSPSTNPPLTPQEALNHLNNSGFVVLPSNLFPSLHSLLPTLRLAAQTLTTEARTGTWPYIRTLPKQFPPWPTTPPPEGIWGVQHLLHPSNPSHLLFAKTYFCPELLDYVRVLIGCEEEELVMELYNMLVRPDQKFELRWHRDDIPASATSEEELERLSKPAWHAQWNLPLYDDSSLIVVPGSHKRARTQVERDAHPYESNLPGQQIVHLKAGEVVFYNNNILHRGVYSSKTERMTLHGSIGSVRAGTERARNVLQHGVGEWADKYDFSGFDEGMVERAKAMRRNLVAMGERSGEVEFYSKDE